MNENEMRIAYYKKKSNFRTAALALDWSKDGLMALPGGRSYNYLSADKVKKNLAPLFPKCGLEFEVDCESVTQMEGIGNMTQHWIVKCNYTIIDVDTGYSVTRSSYGEAADSGDKGVGKARGHAFKRWAIEEFNLADGIDSDSTAYETGTKFKPLSDEEEVKVMSKVQEKAVQKAAAQETPAPKAPEASVPAPSKAPEKTVPAPKAPEKTVPAPTKAPEKTAPAPTQEPKPMSKGEAAITALKAEKEMQEKKYTLAGPQKMAIDRIVLAMTEKAKAGTIDTMQYNTMSMECAEIDSGKKANEFIMKYQPMCN